MSATLSIWSTASIPRVWDLCRDLESGGSCVVLIIAPPVPDSSFGGPLDPDTLVRRLREQLDSDYFQVEREGPDRVVIRRL